MAGRETLPARLHGTGGRFAPAAVCRASSPAILDLPGYRIQSPDCYGKGTSTRQRAVALEWPIAVLAGAITASESFTIMLLIGRDSKRRRGCAFHPSTHTRTQRSRRSQSRRGVDWSRSICASSRRCRGRRSVSTSTCGSTT